MGAESFGLVGLFVTLRSVFTILDMGLATTMNREMASLSIDQKNSNEMRDMVRTLGSVYWVVALIIGIIIFFSSPFIAEEWLNLDKISTDTADFSIKIIAVIMFLYWPLGLYSGGLIGLQRQVLLNIINIIMATLRGAGVLFILWYVSPTIEAYFLWQVFISGLHTLLVMIFLWKSLPETNEATRFRVDLLKKIWKFTSGIAGIMVLSIFLIQIDKIILSKLLSLEMFGYYTFASTVALNLSKIISPIYTALYPRFTQLVSLKDFDKLTDLYHQGCQLMAVLILPISAVIAFFSKEILTIWTNNPELVQNSYLIVSILIVGSALNGLMNLPYALQLAFSWTKLTLYVNSVAVVIVTVLVYILAKYYGAAGAASTWIILNFCFILITIQFMHKRILKKEKMKWYINDVAVPFIVTLIAVGAGRLLFSDQFSQVITVIYIVFTLLISISMAVLFSPRIKREVFSHLRSFLNSNAG